MKLTYDGIIWQPWISNDKVFLNTFECCSKINTLPHFLLSYFVIKTVRSLLVTLIAIRRDSGVKAFLNSLAFPNPPKVVK